MGRSRTGESRGTGSGSKTSRTGDDVAALQACQERGRLDDLAARDVHENRTRTEGRARRAESIPSVVGVCGTRTNTTSAGQDCLEPSERDAVGLGQLPGHERVDDGDLDLERPKQLHEASCEVPKPDHADALAGQLRAVVPGTGTLGERERVCLCVIISLKNAPALRSPTSARPSAHSAVGQDEACEVSTTRTPRSCAAAMSSR